jgi:hypothetical protein
MSSMIVVSVSVRRRFRKSLLRNLGTGMLAAKFGDDVVEVALRGEALALQHFHNRGVSHMLETVASSMDMSPRTRTVKDARIRAGWMIDEENQAAQQLNGEYTSRSFPPHLPVV